MLTRKLLEYLSGTCLSAETVYKIYELVEEHPNKRSSFHAKSGVSADEFARFTDALHNASVSGDWARHAYAKPPKTSNPMSRSEAEQFARNLADQWLKDVRASVP